MEEERTQVPFNIVNETLKCIREWIDKIAEISIGIISGEQADPNVVIVLKYKMVKMLILKSSPLLEETKLENIKDNFEKIEIKFGKVWKVNKWIDNVPVYTAETDYLLDDSVEEIELGLVKYFKPAVSEGGRY